MSNKNKKGLTPSLNPESRKYQWYASRTNPSKTFMLVYFENGKMPDDVVVMHGEEYEKSDECSFDFDSMPDSAKQEFVASSSKTFMRFMQRPDAHQILDAERERLVIEGSTLLAPTKRSQR
ncbi:MAG: hypothetical protein FWC13_07625 [Oscillospiraceae bacterium]|nr:hypothetical protein [Oscillospiraceae bacterium]